jgi:hypothetical protein
MHSSRKIITFIILYLIFNLSVLSQAEKYYKIKVLSAEKTTIDKLSKIGVSFDGVSLDKNSNSIDLYVNEYELKEIDQNNIKYNMLIEDAAKWSEARLINDMKTFNKTTDDLPKGFQYGTMGGYPKLDEYIRMIDTMRLMYPDLVTAKESIGKTFEGRDIYLVRISNYNKPDTTRKRLLYTGLHHAREGMSLTMNLYYMFYLLERYRKDSLITYLLNNRELYFVPMVNPDGYFYNQTTNPNGGGYWRKNRVEINGFKYGVDLNRNYGYMWGYDNNGSSPEKSAETFRGNSAFSENETQAIRDLCKKNNFVFGLNFHTYGGLIVVPWGYSDSETSDKAQYRFYYGIMQKYNNYTAGTGTETVGYTTNGDSDDWMYGEQKEKNKILALTIEMGTNSDDFWAPKSRILPIAQMNLEPALLLTKAAGPFLSLKVVSRDSLTDLTDTAKIKIVVQNIGMFRADNIKITFKSNGDSVISDKKIISIVPLENLAVSDTLTFKVIWNTIPQYSSKATYTIAAEYDGCPVSQTFNIMYRTTPAIFTSFELKKGIKTIQLSWITSAEKSNKKFYIERKDVYSLYTTLDSVNGSITSNTINTYTYTDTIRKSAQYTYRLRTVDSLGYGFYSPERTISISVGVKDYSELKSYALNQNYPNPFNPSTVINYYVGAQYSGASNEMPVSLEIYDVLGRHIATLVNEKQQPGSYNVTFDGSQFAGGVYYYVLRAGGNVFTKKMILVK